MLLAALVVTVHPSHWFVMHCDALSLNLPLLAGCCAAGLWAALRMPDRVGAGGRLGVAGLCAASGAVLYGLIEPACLLGPFGQVNPALKAIWLDRVMESKSILSFGDNQYAPMLAFVAFVVAGIVAQFAIWRARPTTSNALATAMIVLAAMLGCWQIKLMLYASWLAVLPLAVFAARLERLGSLTAPAAGVCVVLLLNQSTLAGVFEAGEVVVRTVVGAPVAEADQPDVGKECARTSNIARLADLPPGLDRGQHRPRPAHRGDDAASRGGGAVSSPRQGHPGRPRDPAWHAGGGRARGAVAGRQLHRAVRCDERLPAPSRRRAASTRTRCAPA